MEIEIYLWLSSLGVDKYIEELSEDEQRSVSNQSQLLFYTPDSAVPNENEQFH